MTDWDEVFHCFCYMWCVVFDCSVILCVRVVERGRVKCGQYWPMEEGRTEQHGYFRIRNAHIQVFQDFILSHLELYNTQVRLIHDSRAASKLIWDANKRRLVSLFLCSVWWKTGRLPLSLSQLARLWGPQKCFGHVGLPWARSSEEGDCHPKSRFWLDRTGWGTPCGCAL